MSLPVETPPHHGKTALERTFERTIFMSRWLLAPFYLGLSLALAVLLATLNLVGGFVVTDRMLEMFGRGRKPHHPFH